MSNENPQDISSEENTEKHQRVSTVEQYAAIVEAILFLESDPIDLNMIAKNAQLDKNQTEEALEILVEKYNKPDSGIEISEIGGGFALTPKLELWESLKAKYGKKNDNRLSRAALETLSIVAYSQPITRAEIENIRGVNSDGMIRILTQKGFIREVGKKDVPGKPSQFGTTKEFLKIFRLNSISDLPKLEELDRDRFQLDGE
jgi:segregation and condensation protein B